MVIKGGSRSGAVNLAAHLLRADTNERVEVLNLHGVAADRLPEALREMEAVATGTRCKKSLYHASLNTGPGEELTFEQKAAAVARLELALGLEGHARAVVEHRKEGRDHLHVVWSRIDVDTMRAVHDGHNYRKHEAVARELEREFGHNRVQGAHVERDAPAGGRQPRPPRTPEPGDVQQATRTKRGLGDVSAELTRLWRAADTGPAFAAALEGAGYRLAQGDRRGFCVVDDAGGVHSLARRIEGAKTKDVAARLAGVELASLPTVDQARAMQRNHHAEREPARPPREGRQAEGAISPAITLPAPLREAHQRPSYAAETRPPAPEPAPQRENRQDGPDFRQQMADSAEYRQERAETTRANDNRPAPRPAAPAREARRAIGRAGGLLGTGLGKAAGGFLGIVGGLFSAAARAAGSQPTRKEPEKPAPAAPAARPEPRPAPPPPERAARPAAPAPAPRPSVFDEIQAEIRAKEQARGPQPAPSPEKERDRERDRGRGMEFRPIVRLAAIVGRDTTWIAAAKRRLIDYSDRTGRAVVEELRELDALIFRALSGPA